MDRIKKGDGQVTTNQQEIIKEQVRFDSDRYRKTVDFQEPSAQAFSDGIDVPQLSDEQKTSIEGARAHTHTHTHKNIHMHSRKHRHTGTCAPPPPPPKKKKTPSPTTTTTKNKTTKKSVVSESFHHK